MNEEDPSSFDPERSTHPLRNGVLAALAVAVLLQGHRIKTP